MSRVSKAVSRAAEHARAEGVDAPARPPAPRSSVVSALDAYPHADSHHSHDDREVEPSERPVAQPTRGRAALRELSRPYDEKLVISEEASPVCRDQYRALAATLEDIQERSKWPGAADSERGLKTLLITSALPGEGKTLTAVNLALTLAES